jgi:hypothetical protein
MRPTPLNLVRPSTVLLQSEFAEEATGPRSGCDDESRGFKNLRGGRGRVARSDREAVGFVGRRRLFKGGSGTVDELDPLRLRQLNHRTSELLRVHLRRRFRAPERVRVDEDILVDPREEVGFLQWLVTAGGRGGGGEVGGEGEGVELPVAPAIDAVVFSGEGGVERVREGGEGRRRSSTRRKRSTNTRKGEETS